MSDYPAAVARAWHPVAALPQLRGRPLSRRLLGRPLVVFKGRDGPAVLIDRCPHRNAALSDGRLRAGDLECPYHGWRFAADGRCTLTPGASRPAAAEAQSLPVVVRAGLIWTCLAKAAPPFQDPPSPVGDPDFDTFWWPVGSSRARLLDAVENLLDPAHPHFLHSGIVRSATIRRPVTAVVRTGPGLAEVVYAEHARAAALMPRLLEGLRTTSIGRAFAPCTGQIAFEGPQGLRLAITVFFTPEDRDHVRPFAHFATPRGRTPALLKEAALRALHMPVLAQDRAALRAQAQNVQRFGGPRYARGPLDFLLPSIQALMEGTPLETTETTVEVLL